MFTSLLPTAFTPTFGTELSDNKGMLMVVITCAGILIVFVVLILLIFIFYAYGGIVRSITTSNEKKAAAKATHIPESAQNAAVSPQTDDGTIPGEIIAVIAAAVAAVGDGKKYAVKKVSRAQRKTGIRSAWAASGIYENTRPF